MSMEVPSNVAVALADFVSAHESLLHNDQVLRDAIAAHNDAQSGYQAAVDRWSEKRDGLHIALESGFVPPPNPNAVNVSGLAPVV